MLHLPARIAGIILSFAPLFVHRSWRYAQALLIGAILTPGGRTVANVLRITGRARDRHFVNTHRVLSRTAWTQPKETSVPSTINLDLRPLPSRLIGQIRSKKCQKNKHFKAL